MYRQKASHPLGRHQSGAKFWKKRKRRSKNGARVLSPRYLMTLSLLLFHWLKGVKSTLQKRATSPLPAELRGEPVFVDASFIPGKRGERGVCGIGVWMPRRRLAIAIRSTADTSMEAEVLAMLTGALTASLVGAMRPAVRSDCQPAVAAAAKLLRRGKGLMGQLRQLLASATGNRAYAHLYGVMSAADGSVAWEPRETNRAADLASNIASRAGTMGIRLATGKPRLDALGDVLSMSINRRRDFGHGGKFRLRSGTTAACLDTGLQRDSSVHETTELLTAILAEIA
ncbi:MAG: hypothetical protein NTZ90_10035 [Proteobacteria bacterium]|nr:hypothetical protein [Pseudomonadota bacterium]